MGNLVYHSCGAVYSINTEFWSKGVYIVKHKENSDAEATVYKIVK